MARRSATNAAMAVRRASSSGARRNRRWMHRDRDIGSRVAKGTRCRDPSGLERPDQSRRAPQSHPSATSTMGRTWQFLLEPEAIGHQLGGVGFHMEATLAARLHLKCFTALVTKRGTSVCRLRRELRTGRGPPVRRRAALPCLRHRRAARQRASKATPTSPAPNTVWVAVRQSGQRRHAVASRLAARSRRRRATSSSDRLVTVLR